MVATSRPPRSPPLPPMPLPLAPRIDRLDSIMKNLEEKKNMSMSAVHPAEKRMPVDLAVREAQVKGSLVDRVRALETRLLQLCLEMESRGTSAPDTSLLGPLKASPSLSVVEPIRIRRSSQLQNHKIKPKAKSKSDQKKQKDEGDDENMKAAKSDMDQTSVATKGKAKAKAFPWFHFKLLGC